MRAGAGDVDVVVIGGGMAGVSLAAALTPGRRVVLVEQEAQLAQHATGRSAAMYVESYGPAPIRALTRASRAALDTTAPDGSPVLHPRPVLWTAFDDDALAELDHLCQEEPRLDRLERREVQRRHGALRGERLAAAVDADACDIDVLALHQHHVRAARAAGVEVRTAAKVLGASTGTNGRLVIDTTAGTVQAEIVVDAAGAWADVVAGAFGATPVGLEPLRRTVAVARPTRPVDPDWPFVIDLGGTFYFKPDGPNVLVSPADETGHEPGDPRADELDIALALDRVNEATDLGLRSVQSSWAGLRTFAPDGNPVVGFDPEVPGLFWFAGQGGYGIQIAPALAALGAALIEGRATPDHLLAEGVDPSDLRPGRA